MLQLHLLHTRLQVLDSFAAADSRPQTLDCRWHADKNVPSASEPGRLGKEQAFVSDAVALQMQAAQ